MKKNDVHEKIISVFSIAGLMTAFISLITTQQGLKQYTFSKDWQAFFISFSIQSALFVCNMKTINFHKMPERNNILKKIYTQGGLPNDKSKFPFPVPGLQ